jgi:hypothetical protein
LLSTHGCISFDLDLLLQAEPRGDAWAKAVMKILGYHFSERNLPATLQYGSDCSGLDSPYQGLCSLLSAIEARRVSLDCDLIWYINKITISYHHIIL